MRRHRITNKPSPDRHRGYKNNHDPGKRRRLTIWLIVCTMVVGWAGFQSFHQSHKIADKRAELMQIEEKLQQTKTAHKELQAKIKRLEDPEFIAELARKEYLMTREGEIIFVQP